MRFGGTLPLLAALVAGCGSPAEPALGPRPAERRATPARPAARTNIAPRYWITARRGASVDDTTPAVKHAIVEGERFVSQNGQLERAQTSAEPPLSAVARVPDHLGGGYLFWNQRALYRAQSFTGSLLPLIDLGASPARLSFGPDFVLVHTGEGSVALDARTGQVRQPSLVNLVDINALDDGRSIALTVTGDALLSCDSGKHWTSIADRLQSRVRALQVHDDDLWFVEEAGEALRLQPNGQLTRHPAPKKSDRTSKDPRWSLASTPIELAAETGLALDDSRALIAVNGSVITVELHTGELSGFTKALVPSASECRLLRGSSEILMLCARPKVSIVRDPLGKAELERSFEAGTATAWAEGMLVFGASCDGERAAGRACVRSATGDYRGYDRSTELSGLVEPGVQAGAAPVPIEVEWVPKRGGGTVGIVSRPHPALIDAASGRLVPISKERASALLATVAAPRAALSSSRVATSDGKIIGYGRDQSYTLLPDGGLAPKPFEFASLASFGSRALAVDRAQRYFESSDYGVTWDEVEGPPGKGSAQGCSEVGCRAEAWLRLGWGPAPPKANFPSRVVPAPPLRQRPDRPRLDCREQQAPSVRVRSLIVPVNAAQAEVSYDFGFGARQLLLSSGARWYYREQFAALGSSANGLHALLYARVPDIAGSPATGVLPASATELLQNKSIQFVNPFESVARVASARVNWKQQADAAARAAGSFPSLQVSDQEERRAYPVAAAPPLYSDGLLLKELRSAVWVRDGRRADSRAVSFGQGRDELEVVDVASHERGELVLLLVDEEERSQVVAAGSKRVQKLFEFGARATALALSASGVPALFFAPVGFDPPSERDPALLVRTGAAPLRLPAWSTLRPASAAECAPSDGDYRLLIRTPRSWLAYVEASGARPAAQEGEMMALVRVSAVRFCLEAVELAAPEVQSGDLAIPTRIIARFGSEPEAGRVGMTLGGEFRQPLSCELR